MFNVLNYTIAGNTLPNDLCLVGLVWVNDGGNCFIPGPDDGLVAVESVESSPNYIPLGQPAPYDHFHLLEHEDVYEKALPILEIKNM